MPADGCALVHGGFSDSSWRERPASATLPPSALRPRRRRAEISMLGVLLVLDGREVVKWGATLACELIERTSG